MPDLSAVIVAAGSSRRMGFDKLTAPLRGQPLVAQSLAAFNACPHVEEIVFVCSEERFDEFSHVAAPFGKVSKVVRGGKERADSVLAGVEATVESEFVAVHDGARPLVTPRMISECFEAAITHGAAVAAEPATDTLHRTNSEGMTIENVPRDGLWRMQTPQILRRGDLLGLLREAIAQGVAVTDEISLLIRAGGSAKVVDPGDWNPKVTYPKDLALVEMILKIRAQSTTDT